MVFLRVALLSCVLATISQEIRGHGMMTDPVSRSTAWRKGFPVPPNYTDNELSCGGVGIQYGPNKGNCGECGDNWSLPRPRPNENGGLYGTGVVVREYKANSRFEINVNLTASHLGHFEFSICPLNKPDELETDECFAKYPVQLADGTYEYKITVFGAREYTIEAVLPEGLVCERCVLRWHYRTANSWGICEDGSSALGCGNQEIFRSCADITITK